MDAGKSTEITDKASLSPFQYFCEVCNSVVWLTGDFEDTIVEHLWKTHNVSYVCSGCSMTHLNKGAMLVCKSKCQVLKMGEQKENPAVTSSPARSKFSFETS